MYGCSLFLKTVCYVSYVYILPYPPVFSSLHLTSCLTSCDILIPSLAFLLFFFLFPELLSSCSFRYEIVASTNEYTMIGCSLTSRELTETCHAFNLNAVLLLTHSRICLPAASHCGLLLNSKSSRTKQEKTKKSRPFLSFLLRNSFPALGLCY